MVSPMKQFFSRSVRLKPFVCIAISTLLASTAVNADVWRESLGLEKGRQFIQAAAVIEPLLTQGDDKEFANLRYAWLNYLQGNYNDAVRAYQGAMELNPTSIDARLGVSLPLMAQLRWREAAKYLSEVLAQSPWDYTAHVRLMDCESNLMQWDQLSRHAGDLVRRYPSDATTLVYLARAEAWKGDKEKAAAAYKKVLVRVPGHIEALQYLGQ